MNIETANPRFYQRSNKKSVATSSRLKRITKGSTVLFAGDCLVVAVCMSIAFYLRHVLNIGVIDISSQVSLLSYLPHYLAGFVLFVFLSREQNLYDRNLNEFFDKSLAKLIKISIYWAVMFLGASLILKLNPPISRLYVGYTFVLMCVFLPLWRSSYVRVAKNIGYDRQNLKRTLLVGSPENCDRLIKNLSFNGDCPYELKGIIVPDYEDGLYDSKLPIVGEVKNLRNILSNTDIDLVIVEDKELSQPDILEIAKVCEKRFIEFNLVPTHFEVFTRCLSLRMICGQPVLGLSILPQNKTMNSLAKRSVDIVGAVAGLFLSIIPMAVLVYLIKREDSGPAFFIQERVGKDGKTFRMIKLRSMKIGSEKYDHLSQSTERDDVRLLKCGAFMRSWNLDELPQFFNVLKGDMSLVGPRPEREYHVSKLINEIPYYQSRHSVRPGMTGWAQVNGLRGDTSLEDRIRHDLDYIENWSIWLDFIIKLRTFVQRNNAY